MIKFIKTHDPKNQHDLLDVEVILPNDVSAADATEAFKAFLLALGYHPESVKEVLNEDEA